MANDPKNANKPDAIKEKMAIGKLGKFYKENCLVDQAFIKDGSMDVKKYVEATGKELGGAISIVEYTHFVKGEGLEKRNEDLPPLRCRIGVLSNEKYYNTNLCHCQFDGGFFSNRI